MTAATRVLLVATGDTIAHCRRRGGEHVADAGQLLATTETRGVRVDTEDLLVEPGWDTSAASMLALARRARRAILDDGYDGVVLACGVDALEETAYLVDLLAGPAAARGAIVLTAAVRALDDSDSDGPGNLGDAIAAAACCVGTGVLVCLGGELHAARWVQVADSSTPRALRSAPFPLVGRVVAGRVTRLAEPPPRPPAPVGEPEPDVALIKTYPGMPSALLMTAVDAGARGVVLEGTGRGNVPVELFGTVGELTGWGIPVVVASRCHTGFVRGQQLPRDVAMATRMGAILSPGLAPPQARVAVMVALGTATLAGVRRWFDQL